MADVILSSRSADVARALADAVVATGQGDISYVVLPTGQKLAAIVPVVTVAIRPEYYVEKPASETRNLALAVQLTEANGALVEEWLRSYNISATWEQTPGVLYFGGPLGSHASVPGMWIAVSMYCGWKAGWAAQGLCEENWQEHWEIIQ